MIVHPVFNAINQLFKQSPSSIKSLMDVALSQSDSNGFNSKTVTMRLEQREWWEKTLMPNRQLTLLVNVIRIKLKTWKGKGMFLYILVLFSCSNIVGSL